MAEMLVQSESLVAIADEVRELSGTTGAMGLDAMRVNLGEANDEVGSQTELLAQIASALEGKASGGSGGGDSGAVETCTLNILAEAPAIDGIIYWTDGTSTVREMNYTGMELMMNGITLECMKNSLVYSSNLFSNAAQTSFVGCYKIDYSCLFVSGDATYIIT